MDVEPPTSDAPLRLSTELLPEHEGGVQAVAALSDDLIVSGGDDSQVFVWHREGPGAKTFMAVAQIDDHKKAVRAIFPLPPCTGLPTGGFATGSLDNNVRLYSVETSPDGGVRVALVRTLEGHMRGVISLSLTSLGELVSGGWEGHVRVWDIASGACRFTLEGHENGTCVVGLPNGDIATGSTGRKSEDNRHVDYKLRLWRMSGSGNLRGYSLYKTIEDHEQAVRDVALLPDAQGWVSVGNDGSVRVRNLDGSVRSTFVNPVSAEGKPHSAFRVCVARALGGAGPHAAGPFVVTANEDDTVRVVDLATGDIYGLKHPGEWRRRRPRTSPTSSRQKHSPRAFLPSLRSPLTHPRTRFFPSSRLPSLSPRLQASRGACARCRAVTWSPLVTRAARPAGDTCTCGAQTPLGAQTRPRWRRLSRTAPRRPRAPRRGATAPAQAPRAARACRRAWS